MRYSYESSLKEGFNTIHPSILTDFVFLDLVMFFFIGVKSRFGAKFLSIPRYRPKRQASSEPIIEHNRGNSWKIVRRK